MSADSEKIENAWSQVNTKLGIMVKMSSNHLVKFRKTLDIFVWRKFLFYSFSRIDGFVSIFSLLL